MYSDSSRFRILHLAFFAAILTIATPATAQTANETYTIGVLPNVSARVILRNYQPMQAYFARELKRKVEIATATDFRAFSAATLRGDYQMVVTAPNLGRVAQLDGKWEPLAIYEPPIPALLVAAADNPNISVGQLKGKSLALANPQSLLALRGLQWLREQGMQDGRDFKVVLAGNDDSLGTMIRSGESPLAMMSMGEFRQIGEATRSTLKIVTEFAKMPGFLAMANPRLGNAERQQLKSLILGFPKSEDGKSFTALAGVANIREVTAAELGALDAFVAQTRAGLAPEK
ncbi:MAG: phosphate starvation-inducible protein PhoH [Betaproteobacteria bacterium]|nr:phosphate starvation-inducible protein PhoH [Betaproteobacteria bacterium]